MVIYIIAVLNGQTCSWKKVLADVPQGSVLGPLLFLIYINDIPKGIKSICKIFADNTSLFSIVKKEKLSQNKEVKSRAAFYHLTLMIIRFKP